MEITDAVINFLAAPFSANYLSQSQAVQMVRDNRLRLPDLLDQPMYRRFADLFENLHQAQPHRMSEHLYGLGRGAQQFFR